MHSGIKSTRFWHVLYEDRKLLHITDSNMLQMICNLTAKIKNFSIIYFPSVTVRQTKLLRENNSTFIYGILFSSGFCRGVNKVFALLICYATLIYGYIPKFRDCRSVPSSRVN